MHRISVPAHTVFLIELSDANAPLQERPAAGNAGKIPVKATGRASCSARQGCVCHPQPPSMPLSSLPKIFSSRILLLVKYWRCETGGALLL